jgi:hypothetical protein
MKALIIKDSLYFSIGQIIEASSLKKGIITKDNHFIKEGCFVPLTKKRYKIISEKLDRVDEIRIKEIVGQVLKTFFWRLYTRSTFVIK